ncbi:MAG: hypothetical protein GY938_16600 [Ketobacter sp.]|nr:hypothetical protein [Ketobacter sp.]
MAINANSYGTVAEVEAENKQFTASDGTFTTQTVPTLSQVEGYIDRTSAALNVCLANQGFSLPVSTAQPKLVLDNYVIEQASKMVRGANTARMNGARSATAGIAGGGTIMTRAKEFIEENAPGLDAMGVTRNHTGKRPSSTPFTRRDGYSHDVNSVQIP